MVISASGFLFAYHLQVAGLIIAPVAMLLMAYSLWMYRKRTAQILRRETVRYVPFVLGGLKSTHLKSLASSDSSDPYEQNCRFQCVTLVFHFLERSKVISFISILLLISAFLWVLPPFYLLGPYKLLTARLFQFISYLSFWTWQI
jgi:heme O synthase-like polyprenyltransferase